MAKPTVAIVGRPNVGKSTLFNRLVGERVAIVEDKPGITRDRIYRSAEWQGKEFMLIDTGGIELDARHEMSEQIRQQAELAVDEADVIVFLLDGQTGLTPADTEVAMMLRRSQKPVIVAVNKVDHGNKKTIGTNFTPSAWASRCPSRRSIPGVWRFVGSDCVVVARA